MKEQQKRKIQQFHPEIEDGTDLRRWPLKAKDLKENRKTTKLSKTTLDVLFADLVNVVPFTIIQIKSESSVALEANSMWRGLGPASILG